ncbi:polyprenol monophosphomannose synthase [Agrococcus sp. HG114]|uniref:polyprenol monophosphomannose synthase n=1 Tax=Agrococcus sp. HG114 TaxID=2969757 RepID=UPI00215AB41B|nr:polyprenol monophosphomannose synthase [Agrococcus sp. HG114]MCR8670419.1 polyprenol monophosphomannose synthase [Agrococcus sp. HG114]
MPRTIVLMPTYDERDALPVTADRLLHAAPDVTLLVIDDGSPDGTGEVAEAMAAIDDRVRVLHRSSKQGLGAAYLAGMRLALDEGFDRIVEMDADGSHPADALPAMLEAADRADLVIGSRWVPGGGIVDWPLHRQLISRAGTLYAQIALGIDVADMTAGYRVYTADLLRRILADEVTSQGYCFQIDMTRRAADLDAVIVEVPITFRERELGRSKMSTGIIGEALMRTTAWGIGRRWGQLRSAAAQLRRTPTLR